MRAVAKHEATRQLAAHLREHCSDRGCFSCGSTESLQIAHLVNQPGNRSNNPTQQCRYVEPENRAAKIAALRAECLRVGILCRQCHDAYDGHYKYGHPRAPFDAAFRNSGVAHAQWPQWLIEFQCLSHALDADMEELFG